MTLQEKNNLVYFYVKAIETCIFFPGDGDISKIIKDSNPLESYIVFQILDIILDINKHNMDATSTENAIRLVHFFKENYIEIPKEELKEKVNNLLIKINNCDDSKMDEFIEKQLLKRHNNETLVKKMVSNLPSSIELVKSFIAFDFEVLVTHSYIKTDEEFDILASKYAKTNISYMGSINAIVSEYPDIKKNQLFMKRLLIVDSKIEKEDIKPEIKKMYKSFRNNSKKS